MNLSPDNRTTLETLLASLSGGVSGAQAAPILAATLQAQAAQQDARRARYQEMATNVANLAGQGMTYGATSNYIDAMTPRSGIPGRFQGLLDSAFANPDIPAQFQDPNVTPGAFSGADGYPTSTPPPAIMNQLQSPMYTQNPQAAAAYNPEAGGGLMTAPQQAQYASLQELMANQPTPPDPTKSDLIGAVAQQLNSMIAAQMPVEEIVARVQSDPQVTGIIMENMNVFMQTHPDIVAGFAPGLGV